MLQAQVSASINQAGLDLECALHVADTLHMAGLRHFPEEDESAITSEHSSLLAAHAKDTKQGHFQFKSSRECYEEFPILVHSGTLLHPSQIPQPTFDIQEGPLSGNRRRPGVVDLEDFKRPRIPGELQSQDVLLREVTTRRMD